MQLPQREWKHLSSAHGSCAHIPEALAGLVDSSDRVRQAARWKIDNHVVLQGDLYEGAPWVARELLSMLQREDLPDPSIVLDLLVEFALGSGVPGSIATSQGRVSIDMATKEVIADGLSVLQAELARGDPRSVSLAHQVIEEIEEWQQDGLIPVRRPG